MQYGDISNIPSPAIILNADLLLTIQKKWFGLRSEMHFLLPTRQLLEQWFRGELSIYIVCIGEYAKEKERVQKLFDTFFVPYSDIITIYDANNLNYLIAAQHVLGYFYFENTLVNVRTNKRKYYQVPNLAEVGYILEGGHR